MRAGGCATVPVPGGSYDDRQKTTCCAWLKCNCEGSAKLRGLGGVSKRSQRRPLSTYSKVEANPLRPEEYLAPGPVRGARGRVCRSASAGW
eukprot:5138988-Pleurochrysis_carterae.AAC.2